MKTIDKIVRKNPKDVAVPVGKYSHITIVPKDATLFTLSGQIGTDEEGVLPESQNSQISNTFKNIIQILESEDLSSQEVIKVNIWAVEKIDWNLLDTEWERFFGNSFPSMTIAYVTALGLQEIKIEIEVWAAKQL